MFVAVVAKVEAPKQVEASKKELTFQYTCKNYIKSYSNSNYKLKFRLMISAVQIMFDH